MNDFQQHLIKIAIEIYGLELDPDRVDTILATWLKQYDPNWILKAIVESLYRGRYKIVSVENILKDWQRLGNPRYQFTPEYEREILEKIPQLPTPEVSSTSSSHVPVASVDVPAASSVPSESDRTLGWLASQVPQIPQAPKIGSKDLNPEESAPFQSHHHSLSSSYSNIPVSSSEESESNSEPTIGEDASAEHPQPARSIPTLDPISRRGRFLNRQDRSKPERIVTAPVSRKLFNTLKAIVDPNYQERSDVRAVATLPLLAIGNDRSSKIATFMPSDSLHEERL
jgi:hypothetical protein